MAHTLGDILASLRVVSIPTRTRFRGITTREAALFEGPEGWTEFSPFLEYDDIEAASWLAAALDFGWRPTPPLIRDRVLVNATVPAVGAEQVAEILSRFDGCTTAKIKVAERGQTLDDDVARVAEVRRIMGQGANIRIDANGAWSVAEALTAIRALEGLNLEYVEQPCATVSELEQLRALVLADGLTVRIAADESVRKASDPIEVARRGAADVVVIKAQPLGGIHTAMAVAAEAGLPTVVSSALDTSVGISMGLHLAAALPEQPFAAGLATAALLAGDVTDDSLLPSDGALRVRRVAPSDTLLASYAASTERAGWWASRIRRTYELLEQ
ncbi:o-succinylbenzoate synthase [Lysinibacter cavernae]|uniref:o-succinylbenzoate synthase n=1 Tax=Lysinibacter cavernae TaxID=1640652 RepID=A0A7X5TTD8_9MICO|nr:o-succinylbenzoate synthase [Lysinibacter cavernae]NIH54085.1 O-succinylbenzoate synthase [Lysinibacter cavernae]